MLFIVLMLKLMLKIIGDTVLEFYFLLQYNFHLIKCIKNIMRIIIAFK